jgi:hypothetical protein
VNPLINRNVTYACLSFLTVLLVAMLTKFDGIVAVQVTP